MNKKLLLLVALFSAVVASAQLPFLKTKQVPRPQEEWNDKEVVQKNCLSTRVNVIPYASDDEIETLDYRKSPYYYSLNGNWKVRYSKVYTDPTDEIMQKEFSTEGWEQVKVPTSQWVVNGKPYKAHVLDNAVSIPANANATALYYKEFAAPKVWEDYHAYLQFTASSAAYVWVNGQYVGYCEDSRVQHEFEITNFLKPGMRNAVMIQSLSISDGSLLETNLDRGYLGLTGDVAIMMKPEVHIRDYRVIGDYNPQSKEFTFKLSSNIYNERKKGQIYIEAELWDPKGKEVEKIGKWVVFDKRDELRVNLERNFYGLKTWSAEDPNCYTLVLRLRDKEMNLLETVGCRFGFRRVEMEDGLLKVNGNTVTLHGTVYADYAMVDNGVNSRERIKRDLQLMKQYNINAVRTAYYSPASPYFYECCDVLGLYVICDANLQPFTSAAKVIATDNDYSRLFETRINDMVGAYKNYTSIIVWSLGNSTDNGVCMEAAYKTLNQKDKTRPVLYAGAQYSENTDIIATTKGSVDYLKQYLAKEQSRPLVLSEFGSSKGNNFGGMDEMWQLIGEKEKLQGGFFAYWNPFRYTQGGESITVSGAVDRHQNPAPYLAEIRNLYRDFHIRILNISPDGGEFSVANRSNLHTLNDYVLEYNIFSNLKSRIIDGEVRMDLNPGEDKTFRLKIPYMQLYAGEELFIRFTIKQRHATASIAKGQELGVIEFPLPMRKVARQSLPDYDRRKLSVTYRDSDGNVIAPSQPTAKKGKAKNEPAVQPTKYEITNGQCQITFDATTADITNLTFEGKEMLKVAPRLNFWRAATDNDRADKNGLKAWQNLNPDQMVREVVATNCRKIDDYTYGIDAMLRYTNSEDATLMDVKQSIVVLHTGDILIDNEMVLSEKVRILPKVGMQMGVAKKLTTTEWFGKDKESYTDRNSAAMIGVYQRPTQELFYHYDRPQESGNRSEVRWVAFHDSVVGLFVDMVDTQFNFSVYPYTDRQLATQENFDNLSAQDYWVTNIDYLQAAVGSTLGGIPIDEAHLIDGRKFHFRVHLHAYSLDENDPQDFRRISYPTVESSVLPMPEIVCSKERFDSPMSITLTCSAAKAKIHYTLDGSTPTEKSPLYTKPFVINGSTLVKARTFMENSTPSFTTTQRYIFDYITSATFDNKPNTPYNYNADKILFDGEFGNVEGLTMGWLGFSGNDLSATFTLAKAIELDKAVLRFAHVPDAWVFAPAEVLISVSSDGEAFSEPIPAMITYNPASKEMNSTQLVTLTIPIERGNVKYVKLVAKNLARIPQWHKAKGLKSWLLMDEIQLHEVVR